jgi:FlaG/FlaF family flagellin (archaellin)
MPLNAGTQVHRSLVVNVRGSFSNIEKHPRLLSEFKMPNRKTAAVLVVTAALLVAAVVSVSALGGSNSAPALTDNKQPKPAAPAALVTGSQAAGSSSSASSGTTASSSSSVNVDLNSSSTNGVGSANLKVNGQQVPVSDPNFIHQTFSSDNGNSTVNIDVTNGGGM